MVVTFLGVRGSRAFDGTTHDDSDIALWLEVCESSIFESTP